MIRSDSRPRLAPGVRLRVDHVRGGSMLLCPERGVTLDRTASAILRLCSGDRDVDEIVALLRREHEDAPEEAIERDVLGFLRALERRRFIVTHTVARRP
jgi:pyrroloquinoline quinone biosynthesis protein D